MKASDKDLNQSRPPEVFGHNDPPGGHLELTAGIILLPGRKWRPPKSLFPCDILRHGAPEQDRRCYSGARSAAPVPAASQCSSDAMTRPLNLQALAPRIRNFRVDWDEHIMLHIFQTPPNYAFMCIHM